MTGNEFKAIIEAATARQLQSATQLTSDSISDYEKQPYWDNYDTKAHNVNRLVNWAVRTKKAQTLLENLAKVQTPVIRGDVLELSRSHPEVKAMLDATYPEYNGRKIRLVKANKYHMSDYWSGGSRDYAVAYHLATGRVVGHGATDPFQQAAHSVITIPDGVAIVEHSIFQGKDIGIRVHVNSNTFPKLLSAGR